MVRSRRVVQLFAVLALAAVVVVGAIALSGGNDEPETAAPVIEGEPSVADQVKETYDGIPQKGIRLGEPDAPATLVEIADLQCPFCAHYSTTAMDSVVRDYVRTGKLRYELHFRSFLGRDSVRAAGAAAYAAKQNRMYEFADVFYRHQGPEESGYADTAFIRSIALQVEGLDPEKAVAAANNPLARPAVAAGERYAREIGSTGTPDFYIRRGTRMRQLNVQGDSPESYASAIDQALR